MPSVNIYGINSKNASKLKTLIPDLKKFLADKLTCGDIKLSPSEISIRFLNLSGGEMIGDIELEITAHAFPERINKQDEICLDVMNYLMEKSPSLGDVKVWLKLSELGHSWH